MLEVMIRRAPCDIAIMKTRRMEKDPERIVLVSGGYFETRKALLLALPIAKEYAAGVEILTVVTDDKQLELMRGNAERLKKICDRVHVPATIKTVRSKTLVETVVAESKGCDLLVLGAGPQRTLERTLFGTVYDRIIRSVDVPVLLLRTPRTEKGGERQHLPTPLRHRQ